MALPGACARQCSTALDSSLAIHVTSAVLFHFLFAWVSQRHPRCTLSLPIDFSLHSAPAPPISQCFRSRLYTKKANTKHAHHAHLHGPRYLHPNYRQQHHFSIFSVILRHFRAGALGSKMVKYAPLGVQMLIIKWVGLVGFVRYLVTRCLVFQYPGGLMHDGCGVSTD